MDPNSRGMFMREITSTMGTKMRRTNELSLKRDSARPKGKVFVSNSEAHLFFNRFVDFRSPRPIDFSHRRS